MRAALLHFLRNNQQHFNSCNLAILTGRPELPLLKRIDHELGLRELRRKDDVERLKAARLIDKAVDHDGIGVDGAGTRLGRTML